ncbi:MAG: hypothetical protein PHV32_04700 [Eubacteriales bacterium]|nr:hypothetical protein [Oscillospiraceae bacterium]MDD4493636.1 hypothetical protein [Eubacteriales bacterium]
MSKYILIINELVSLKLRLGNLKEEDSLKIIEINERRESLFKILELYELAFIIHNNLNTRKYQIDYSLIHDYEDILSREALLKEYRMMSLFECNNIHELDLLNIVGKCELEKEYTFWIDYFLGLLEEKSDMIFYKMTDLTKKHKFSEALNIGYEYVHKNYFVAHAYFYCLFRLQKYQDIIELLCSNKCRIKDNEKDEFELQALYYLYENNKEKYATPFKKKYIEIIKNHDVYNYCGWSPYIASRLDKSCEEIAHYTSLEALKSILENNELWATKHDFLNDYNEHKYLLDLVREPSLTSNSKNVIHNSLKRHFVHQTDEVEIPDCGPEINRFIDNDLRTNYMKDIYVLSFSTEDNNLTLWGNYSKFQGYNLKFNRQKLINGMMYCNINESQDVIIEGKIIYLEEDDTFVNDLANEILTDMSANGIDENISIKIIVSHLLLMGLFIKSKTMDAEKEYRIVSLQRDEVNISTVFSKKSNEKMKMRQSNNVFIPYTILHGDIVDCVEQITIGPLNNLDIAEKGMKCFLDYKGLSNNINIKKSKITLRY